MKMSEEGSSNNSRGGDGASGSGNDDKKPSSSHGNEKVASGASAMENIERLMRYLNPWKDAEKEKPEQVLGDISLEGVAKYMQSPQCKNVIVMTGAGISTSAGIPDFRTPGTGLYDNLEKYNLPTPQAIFEIGYFKKHPEAFFYLAKELYPDMFKPTPCHYFIRLLAEKYMLLRNYTQNIDTLERQAGVPGDLMMEAHGTFHTGHCLGECSKEYTQEWMKEEIFAKDRIPKCPDCGDIVKPDIVFFGEALPKRFSFLVMEDFPKCDLLIVMGTSLVVQPFASLVDRVPDTTPRLLINMEKSGESFSNSLMRQLGMGRSGFEFDSENNYRDVAYLGTCDDGCYKLAELLGWKDELEKMVEAGHKQVDKAQAASKNSPKDSTSKKTPSSKVKTASIVEAADEVDQNKSDKESTSSL